MSEIRPTNRVSQLGWIEWVKRVALSGNFLVPVTDPMLCYPYLGNSSGGWPPESEWVARLAPPEYLGAWGVPLKALRFVDWIGNAVVQLLSVASGCGRTWSVVPRL
jgi:hypothetical protein